MTSGNNGASTPEDDDPFGYLYADGQANGAQPPSGGGYGYGYPGSVNRVRAVGQRQYGQQATGRSDRARTARSRSSRAPTASRTPTTRPPRRFPGGAPTASSPVQRRHRQRRRPGPWPQHQGPADRRDRGRRRGRHRHRRRDAGRRRREGRRAADKRPRRHDRSRAPSRARRAVDSRRQAASCRRSTRRRCVSRAAPPPRPTSKGAKADGGIYVAGLQPGRRLGHLDRQRHPEGRHLPALRRATASPARTPTRR